MEIVARYFLLFLMIALVGVVSCMVSYVIYHDKKIEQLNKKAIRCPNCSFRPIIMNYKGCYRVECKVCGYLVDDSTFFAPEHAVNYWNRIIIEDSGDKE